MLKEYVSQLNREFTIEASSSLRLLEDMAAMEKYLAESYSGRIFIELLQNADDAQSKKIKLLEHGNHLVFANDGRPFNENDLLAISRSGASTKERGSYIGYRGIGFKSTTYLTNEIVIFSDNTYFTFSKRICAEKIGLLENKTPTLRIPFLIEKPEYEIDQLVRQLSLEGYSTIFVFKNAHFNEFFEEINEINNGYFLFLKNISLCEIDIKSYKATFSISRTKSIQGKIVSITGMINEEWLVLEDNNTQIAFKYESGKIVPCNESEAVYHCYLPTLDKTVFRCKINGNFSTDPSRKHVTFDEQTRESLCRATEFWFKILSDFLNQECAKSLSGILEILVEKMSFSRTNSFLLENLKRIITSSSWLKINDGSVFINPVEYLILPDWLEESEKSFIRKHSNYVQKKSLPKFIYESISGVDPFLEQFSTCSYTTLDLINIMEELSFVSVLNFQTQGKLLAKLAQAIKSESFISGNKANINNVYIRCYDGLHTISEIAQNETLQILEAIKDTVNQYSSKGDIEWLCNSLSIEKERLLKEKINEITSFITVNELVSPSKSIVSKWRSAEQQCIELEKNLGYEPIDVSIQNLGYDIESTTHLGHKRLIEVKSIPAIGSPFSITNNEYTAAHQFGESYLICLLIQSKDNLTAIYIKDPLKNLHLEKRIKQWEWYCDSYEGERISFNY